MKHFIVPITFFLTFFSLSAQTVKSNKEILDSFFLDYSLEIINKLSETRNSEIILKFDETASSYFQDFLTNELLKSKIKIFTKAGIGDELLEIKVSLTDFQIIYELLPDDDFKRSIRFKSTCFITDKNGSVNQLTNIKREFTDNLSADKMQTVEDPLLPVTKGKVPPPKSSWYDEILEPAIIISASVVSIILFFSVRSK